MRALEYLAVFFFISGPAWWFAGLFLAATDYKDPMRLTIYLVAALMITAIASILVKLIGLQEDTHSSVLQVALTYVLCSLATALLGIFLLVLLRIVLTPPVPEVVEQLLYAMVAGFAGISTTAAAALYYAYRKGLMFHRIPPLPRIPYRKKRVK